MRKLHISELNRRQPGEFRAAEKWPVRIILDNIRSRHNIGSVFRTADAFAVEAICLCGITATPPDREIHKTALGATESVYWEYYTDTLDAVLKARNDGYRVVLVEQTDHSLALDAFDPVDVPLALVFGNEVNGVSEHILPQAHQAIEIPQFGTKHSFNISVCAGIVLYDLFRRRKH